MKSNRRLQKRRIPWRWASFFTGCLSVTGLGAADTNAPAATPPKPLTPEQMFEGGTESYENWIDFGVGAFPGGGNKAEFERRHQHQRGMFGGIEDFHYQKSVAKDTVLSVDGRAIGDTGDYKFGVGVARENTGYVRVGYDQFRTYYNGDGGVHRPTGAYYPLEDEALTLDRGEITFETGLTLENKPKVTLKYTHAYRDGEKGSTKWGAAQPGGSAPRGIAPSFYDIDERRDTVELDVTHHIKTTDMGVGLRYDGAKLDNELKISQFPGEPGQQKITEKEGTTYDLFHVHTFTETWFKKNLMFSSGLSYTDLESDWSGSRIYGTDFDVGYVPSAQNGLGFYGLNGGSSLHEYVVDLNLMSKPSTHFTVVPSIRVTREDMNADVVGVETLGANPSASFNGRSDAGTLDVRERLDLTYTGITNWVLYARGESTQGEGDLTEYGGLEPINSVGVAPVYRESDNSRFFQKYSAGARWYPTRRLSIDAGGYYKLNRYDYDHGPDSTANNSFDRYPGYLSMQEFDTQDGNIRITTRPRQNLTLVSRYEYQHSTIDTELARISGLGESESSRMNSHILAQDVSWVPWTRLFLQAGFNYVISKTETPGSDVTRAILDAENNYWTATLTSGLVLDERTDLNLSYFYYSADNFEDNSDVGVPLGMEAEEHGVTATLIRRIRKNLRVSLKYGFFHYEDVTFAGNRNYYAHLVYTSLRYRF